MLTSRPILTNQNSVAVYGESYHQPICTSRTRLSTSRSNNCKKGAGGVLASKKLSAISMNNAVNI